MSLLLEYPELVGTELESPVQPSKKSKAVHIVAIEVAIQLGLLYVGMEAYTYIWRLLSCPC